MVSVDLRRMLIVRLATAAVIAVIAASGCSPAARPAAAPGLDGTYRVTIDGRRTHRDGVAYPEPSTAVQWAFRSACRGDACVAVAVAVSEQDPPKTGEPAVWDLVDGAWVKTVDGQLNCGGVPTPTLETWSLRPADGGGLTGTRHLAFFGPGCGAVLEQSVIVERIGDVKPAVALPDPAAQPPLIRSAGAGLRGRYQKIQTYPGRPPLPVVELAVRTNCIRNTEHCLTYTVYEPPDKPRRVSGYRLRDRMWTAAVPYDGACPDGAPVRVTVETGWAMPPQVTDPIVRLVGTQRDVYAEPCANTVESQLVLQRIGD